MARMGRPTSDPKQHIIKARATEDDIKRLEYCCKATGKNMSEIVRAGIEIVYNELKNNG